MSLDNPLYSKNALEFVAVGLEYCRLLESCAQREKAEFVEKLTKLLPLLYLKASLLPSVESDGMVELEQVVTEEQYEMLRLTIVDLLEADDVFLDTFVEDMKYSEAPIACSIAEGATDIYQDIKTFVEIYRLGVEGMMLEVLSVIVPSFKEYWGQSLVNIMRPLHTLAYTVQEENEDLF